MKPGTFVRDRRPRERVVTLVLFSCCLYAFAPLRAEVAYPPVVPGVELEFPRNEGAHPDYRIEWWYVTGWVQDEAGAPLGFQVTFFRVRPGLGESNPSRFAPTQILFGHAAVADPAHGRLRHAERSARAGFDLAYAREGRVDLRLDDWSLRQDGDRYRAVVAGEDFALRLDLDRVQPPLLQGERGYSRKGPSPDQASYYYSLPQLRVSGEIVLDGRRRAVTGEAWFDHEWSSDVMDAEARGWDWLGVNLEDGGALMAFRMRDAAGNARWAAATLREPDGSVRTFKPDGGHVVSDADVALTAHRRRVPRRVARARGRSRVRRRAADGRRRARLALEHRHDLLGRADPAARARRRAARPRLPRAHRLRGPPEPLSDRLCAQRSDGGSVPDASRPSEYRGATRDASGADPLTRRDGDQSCAAANVSQAAGSPVSSPRLNQRMRCSELPCVNPSGTTRPCVCFWMRSSPIALAARRPSSTSPASSSWRERAALWAQTPA